MPLFSCERDNARPSAADFASTLKVLQKYAAETRSDVESVLTSADQWPKSKINRRILLTKLKINQDILTEYHAAIQMFRSQPEFEEMPETLDGLRSEREAEINAEEINFESAVSTIHEVRVLLIQLPHIIPLLENEKTTVEMIVLSKTDDRRIDDVAEKFPTKEDTELEKVNSDLRESGSELSSENIEEKHNVSLNTKKLEKDQIEKMKGDTEEKHGAVDADNDGPQKLATITKEMTTILLQDDTDEEVEPSVIKLSQIIWTKSFENLSLYANFVQIFNEDRSEGTFIYVIDKISRVSGTVKSRLCDIQNLSWGIKLTREQDTFKLGKRNLTVYVYCAAGNRSTWSCFAEVHVVLLSQKDGIANVSRTIARSFSVGANEWCTHDFIEWDTLMNPLVGYIKNDKIMLQVIVKPKEVQPKVQVTCSK